MQRQAHDLGQRCCLHRIRGHTANFPAARGIFTSVTGFMATAVPGGPSDAGLVHSALDGDVASLSALLDRYRAGLYARAVSRANRTTRCSCTRGSAVTPTATP